MVIIMLSLKNLLGVGQLANSTVKINIKINRGYIENLLEKKKIQLDKEALEFLKEDKFSGTLDYGTREIDFFPDNKYFEETELALQ